MVVSSSSSKIVVEEITFQCSSNGVDVILQIHIAWTSGALTTTVVQL